MKVTQALYSGKGGHGSVAHSLIRADKDHVFEHKLIYFGIETMDPDYVAFCKSREIEFEAIHKIKGKHFKSWRIYLKALKKQRPDSIILHSMTLILPTIWYCIFHRTKLVAVEHQNNEFKRNSEWWWSFFALLFASRVVYLTEFYRTEILSKLSFRTKPKKVCLIPNGIDTDYFVPGKSSSDGKLKIGMASRINALRDHNTLIYSFEILCEDHPNIELHIAGDGEGMENLRKTVAESVAKDSIFLHGNLGEPQLLKFLQDLDVYVHCTYAETMSTAVMQAMSVGLPVVVTRIPGNLSLLEEGKEGFFYESEDAGELAEKVEWLLEDGLLRNQAGQLARQNSVAAFSFEAMFEKYRLLLQNNIDR